jgi:hypothetical protein
MVNNHYQLNPQTISKYTDQYGRYKLTVPLNNPCIVSWLDLLFMLVWEPKLLDLSWVNAKDDAAISRACAAEYVLESE